MDEARLTLLRDWLQEKILLEKTEHGLLSTGKFDSFDDFLKLVELARAGLLNDGKRLASIDYILQPEQREVLLTIADQSLRHPDMTISPKHKS